MAPRKVKKSKTSKSNNNSSNGLSRKDLIKAADEMNEVMGLEPAIDTSLDTETLKTRIINDAADIEPDDDFSKNTMEVIALLQRSTKKSEEPEKEEKSDDEGDNTGVDLIDLVKSTTKTIALKELVNKHDAFKPLRKKLSEYQGMKGSHALKKDMYGLLGDPSNPKEKTADVAEKKKAVLKPSGELSNKAKVYQAWKKGEIKTSTLHKIVAKAVKETTINTWINQWKNGKNLPAIAKK